MGGPYSKSPWRKGWEHARCYDLMCAWNVHCVSCCKSRYYTCMECQDRSPVLVAVTVGVVIGVLVTMMWHESVVSRSFVMTE